MPRFASGFVLAAVLLALGACAPEPPPEEPLPLPPPPPPRLATARQPVPPVRPDTNGAAENGTEGAPGAAGEASEPAAVTEAAASVPIAPRQVVRVARDGTIGCADPNALRLLRQLAGAEPRLLVEARAAGGCRTTFRVNEWVAEGGDAETVRMRLTNGAPLTLWFLRSDLAAP